MENLKDVVELEVHDWLGVKDGNVYLSLGASLGYRIKNLNNGDVEILNPTLYYENFTQDYLDNFVVHIY